MFGLPSSRYQREYDARMEEAQERLMDAREAVADATALARKSARMLRRIKPELAL